MMERDIELNRVLRTWTAPQPGKGLDARVLEAYRRSKPARPGNARWWIAAAAGVVLVAGVAHLGQPDPESRSNEGPVRLVSATNVHGYRPLPNGEITVVKGKKTQ